jgi:tetratricopeptide (TPR) repeat protein
LKSLKRVFEVAKLPNSKNKDFSWVLPIFELAFTQTESDVWLKREYAILLGLSGQKEEAISLYKKVILELSDKSYAWHELSTLVVQDIELAISMLCKAILIEKDESYLGKIRLELAKHLISKEMLTEAKLELNKYIENVNSKGWKTSDEFSILNEKLSGVSVNETENNLDFYQQYITKVDDFIYSELPWVDLMLFDKWDADNGKTRLAFTSLNKTELVVNAHKFKLIKHANLNDIFQFKLHHDEVNNKYSALKVQKSDSTKANFISNAPEDIAVVDHINSKKELFHYVINSKSDGIVKFSNTTIRPKAGDFIKIKYFKTYNKKMNSYKTNVISIEPTSEINTSLVKSLTGHITLKYKFDGRTHDYEDVVHTIPEIDTNEPDFGFVADYYVPKFMLGQKSVYKDCEVAVKVLFNGEKWSVFELNKI